MTDQKTVNKLSAVGIGGNIILTAFKLYAGIAGKSGAMVSDAIHSLSDVAATFIAFLGVKVSGKSADAHHPYGHERFECVAAMALGLILAVTGISIGMTGIRNIASGNYGELAIPTILPLIAAVVSIAVKEGMYHYTMYYAKKLNSAAFVADAWHHRSDALSSIGSFIGIGAARLGFPVMDSVASILICVCILKVAYDVLKDALQKMLDTSCSTEDEKKLYDYISKEPGVQNIDLLQTRMFGNKIYVDVEISVDRNSSLIEAHGVAESLHSGLEKAFPNIKHVMIHVNPGVSA